MVFMVSTVKISRKVDMSTPVTEDGRTDERKVENRAVFCWTRNRNDSEAHRVVMVIMMVIFTLELEKNVKKDFIRQASSQCIGVGLAQTRTQGLRNSYGE